MRTIFPPCCSWCRRQPAQRQAATAYKSTEVAPGIYLIEGADGFGGGNIGLLAGEDYIAMIDDGLVPTAEILFTYVKKLAGGRSTSSSIRTCMAINRRQRVVRGPGCDHLRARKHP